MAKKVKPTLFLKMEATGNDFVLLDELRKKRRAPSPAQIRKVCDRRFGIGADGVLLLLPGKKAAFAMRVFNADGSEAESCGNGIACVSKLVFERYKKKVFSLETEGGVVQPSVLTTKKGVEVSIDMGTPIMNASQIPVRRREANAGNLFSLRVQNRTLKVGAVSMGNPHCIVVTPLSEKSFFALAPKIETLSIFPKKTNVHALRKISRKTIEILIWERGAGRTLSCGTGACAAFALALHHGWVEKSATVVVPGGKLRLSEKAGHIFLRTAPHTLFTGETLFSVS